MRLDIEEDKEDEEDEEGWRDGSVGGRNVIIIGLDFGYIAGY